jgi:hypothetical protein
MTSLCFPSNCRRGDIPGDGSFFLLSEAIIHIRLAASGEEGAAEFFYAERS